MSTRIGMLETVSSDAFVQVAIPVGAAALAAAGAAYWKASIWQIGLAAFVVGSIVGGLFVREQLQDAENDRVANAPDAGAVP